MTREEKDAMDIVIGGIEAANKPSPQSQVGAYALRQGYLWGGTWTQRDPVHFALQNTGSRE